MDVFKESGRFPGRRWVVRRTDFDGTSIADLLWDSDDGVSKAVGSFDTVAEALIAVDALEGWTDGMDLPLFKDVDLENGILDSPLSGGEDVVANFGGSEVVFGFGRTGVSVRLLDETAFRKQRLVAKLTFPENSELRDALGCPGPAVAAALHAVMKAREIAGLGMEVPVDAKAVPPVPLTSDGTGAADVNVLQCFFRTDLASMDDERRCMQAMRIQRCADAAILEQAAFGPSWKSIYAEWGSRTTFGATTSVDAGDLDAVVRIVDGFGRRGMPSGMVHDPAHPVRDGSVTHLVGLHACGWGFGPPHSADIPDPQEKTPVGGDLRGTPKIDHSLRRRSR